MNFKVIGLFQNYSLLECDFVVIFVVTETAGEKEFKPGIVESWCLSPVVDEEERLLWSELKRSFTLSCENECSQYTNNNVA